ncbi:MAG TPA: hypothetical protein VIY49_19180 [Bryobacteraceae bacterium]
MDSKEPKERQIQLAAKRIALRAIVAEAIKLADDGNFPVVLYDLAHAHAVLGYSSDREAATR